MKRKLDNNTYFKEEIKNSRNIKRKSITTIEHLSNDLFYEIFDYFEGFDLYNAFSNLNIRFQDLLQCIYLRLKIYFPFQREFHFQYRLQNVIVPNKSRIISLCINGIRNNDAIFSSMIIDSSFNRLESLILGKIKFNILLSVLRSLSVLSRLFSLTIIVSGDIINNDNPYILIFNLSTLKYIKFSFEKTHQSMELWTNNNYQLNTLQYMILDHSCNLSTLIDMLSFTPQLRHLSYRFLYELNQSIRNNIEITLPNLTHLSFYECHLSFNQLEIFIKKISSTKLQVLHLTTRKDQAYFNGDRWKQLIIHYIPHLRLFQFEHQEIIHHNIGFTTNHALIHHFTSTFWIKPRWNIKFNIFVDILWKLSIIFSINSSKKEWYQLNELNKNTFNSDQSFQSIILIISDCSSTIDILIPICSALPITHLNIQCQEIFIEELIKILNLLPNLDSLKMQSLVFSKPRCLLNEEVKTLALISNKNNITKVNIGLINELSIVQLLIDLCPHLQYFEIGCSAKIDLKLLIKSILMKTTQNITQLRTLCINGEKPSDRMIKELQDMINHEQWFQNYTIHCTEENICIQLE